MKKQDSALLGYALVMGGLAFWLINTKQSVWFWLASIFILAPLGAYAGWALGKEEKLTPTVEKQTNFLDEVRKYAAIDPNGNTGIGGGLV